MTLSVFISAAMIIVNCTLERLLVLHVITLNAV